MDPNTVDYLLNEIQRLNQERNQRRAAFGYLTNKSLKLTEQLLKGNCEVTICALDFENEVKKSRMWFDAKASEIDNDSIIFDGAEK